MVQSLQFGASQYVTMSRSACAIRTNPSEALQGYTQPFSKADHERFNGQVQYHMKKHQDYAGDSKHPVIAVRLHHFFPYRMDALIVSGEKDIKQLLSELRERKNNPPKVNKCLKQGDSYSNVAESAQRPVAQVYNWAKTLEIPDLESCLEQADREVLEPHINVARIYNKFEFTA